MKKTEIKKGDRYGRLVIVNELPIYRFPSGKTKRRFECKCDCGNISFVMLGNLRCGRNQSCGCINKIHGMSYSKTYKIWDGVKQRCLNKNNRAFKYYGERGIKICSRWVESFNNFLEDMGEKPINTSLERINNDGNYEKSNCKWASLKEQNRNRRFNKFITYNGKTQCVSKWAEEIDIKPQTIYRRLKLGWSDSKTLTQIVRPSYLENRTKFPNKTKYRSDMKSDSSCYWSGQITKRDNHICKINNKNCDGRLETHHILGWKEYPELRYDINNGITLCHFHHPKTREDEKKLSPYFKELITLTKN